MIISYVAQLFIGNKIRLLCVLHKQQAIRKCETQKNKNEQMKRMWNGDPLFESLIMHMLLRNKKTF